MRATVRVGKRSFEIGNNDLEAESAFSLDPSMPIHADRYDATAGIFSKQFSSYIYLHDTEEV